MKALVIEDSPNIAGFLSSSLKAEYFEVDAVFDGEKGSFLARTNRYDIIILDNPVLDNSTGKKICQQIREKDKQVPIIVLSPNGEISTKIEFLNIGADDYLTKPFSFEELIARIKVFLRRPQRLLKDHFEVDDLVMDVSGHIVRRGGEELFLTRKEFMLLELLLRRKGEIVSRGVILEHVWDMNADPFSNTIEVHIRTLRKKLNAGGKKNLIKTISGSGYKILA